MKPYKQYQYHHENDSFFKALAKAMKREHQLAGLITTLTDVMYDPKTPEEGKDKALERLEYVKALLKERRDREQKRRAARECVQEETRQAEG